MIQEKIKCCLVSKQCTMKIYWDVQIKLHAFVTTLYGGYELSATQVTYRRRKNPRYPTDRKLDGR